VTKVARHSATLPGQPALLIPPCLIEQAAMFRYVQHRLGMCSHCGFGCQKIYGVHSVLSLPMLVGWRSGFLPSVLILHWNMQYFNTKSEFCQVPTEDF
jgi:hypothetical protein